MPDVLKEPCNQCPYRRKAMPGYLGESTPEEFMASTMADYPMPCHKTIDYRDPRWKEKWENLVVDDELDPASQRSTSPKEKHCAGAAIFFSNIHKRTRDMNRPGLAADRDLVFDHPRQFIDHHRSLGVGSWESPTKK